MSQRLISKTRRPIHVTTTGLAVFALRGAEDDDGDGEEGGEGGEGGDDGGSGSGSEGQDGDEKDGQKKSYSAEEYEALKRRMQEADRNAEAARKKAKEYEDKDKDELTKATDRVTELETSLADKDKVIADLRFENAFALNPKHSWHDPEVVLNLVRKRDDVTVEEDGTIKGLDKALDALAKEKPFLVKNDDGDDSGPPATGSATGSGKKRDPKAPDEAAVRSKYRI